MKCPNCQSRMAEKGIVAEGFKHRFECGCGTVLGIDLNDKPKRWLNLRDHQKAYKNGRKP